MKVKEWNEFYHETNKDWYNQHVQAVKGYGNRIARFTPKGSAILEVGFGTGQISIYLSLMKDKGYCCHGIDSNQEQVKRALLLAKELDSKACFWYGDIFNPDLKDGLKEVYHTSFSQGLLEHFESYDIKAILKNQFTISKVVAFSVPLDKFGHQSRGDEILRSEKAWSYIISEFSKEYDIDVEVLYWETYAKGTQLMGVLTR
jgi:SAM-dependent methyltransferase